jgi:hypothetical protein
MAATMTAGGSYSIARRQGALARGMLAEPALEAALAACRAHLAQPDTNFTVPALVQTWGRVPAAA